MPDPRLPVVIVGAGISGLACARALTDARREVVVLERARGVGGRCATRRLDDGQPVDLGVAFLHGRDPEFLAALAEVPAPALQGWPREILGTGRPCHPEAFAPGERRLAWATGANALASHLARGLDVRFVANVTGLTLPAGAIRFDVAGVGKRPPSTIRTRVAVLALAAEQVNALLGTIADAPASVRGARALLETAESHACLALAAVYGPEVPPPPWHASYPEDSTILQLAAHDSSKREAPRALVIVYQAHAAWSRRHVEDPAWPDALLAEAARVLGPWAAQPVAREPHRWEHARTDRAAELTGPLLLALEGGARLGVCGDRFSPGAGVEAAWRSGRALAKRILEEAG